jgi:hypothetical protein
MNDLFGKMFELLFKGGNMNADLADNNVYGTVGIIMLILSILIPCIFYFMMDKARYAGFKFWFLWNVILFVLTFGITFFLARRSLTTLGADYAISQYLYFSAIVALYGSLIFFILSIILKRFTTSLSRSPF